jgi:hypothetical protein
MATFSRVSRNVAFEVLNEGSRLAFAPAELDVNDYWVHHLIYRAADPGERYTGQFAAIFLELSYHHSDEICYVSGCFR